MKAGKPPIYDREALNLTKEEIEKQILSGIRPYWRFKLSQNKVQWTDLVKGKTEVDLSSQSDPVLRRADGSYLYHFPSVVDDIDMKITHIIRGEDHLSNSAVHVEIFQSLDAQVPSFGHNPLMLNEDGTKLSKRNVDSISIKKFKEEGYSTESILSYLYSVGLNADYSFKEISKNEYVDFDLSKISKNLPKLDLSKIDHFQKLALRTLSLKELLNEFNNLIDFEIKENEWNLIKNNVEKYSDILEFLEIIRRNKIENSPSEDFIKLLVENIDKFDDLDFEEYTKQISQLNTNITKKEIFINTRYLLTGNNNGPSVKDLFEYYGFNEIKNYLNEFKLFNTLTKTKEDFNPINHKSIKMYACGPTLYNNPHIGNFRPIIVFDILFRILQLKFGEGNVTYVRNITDIDDKIINKANELNISTKKLVEQTQKVYHEDLKSLSILEPTHEPKATEYISKMIEMITSLIQKEYAYVSSNHVLFESKNLKIMVLCQNFLLKILLVEQE